MHEGISGIRVHAYTYLGKVATWCGSTFAKPMGSISNAQEREYAACVFMQRDGVHSYLVQRNALNGSRLTCNASQRGNLLHLVSTRSTVEKGHAEALLTCCMPGRKKPFNQRQRRRPDTMADAGKSTSISPCHPSTPTRGSPENLLAGAWRRRRRPSFQTLVVMKRSGSVWCAMVRRGVTPSLGRPPLFITKDEMEPVDYVTQAVQVPDRHEDR